MNDLKNQVLKQLKNSTIKTSAINWIIEKLDSLNDEDTLDFIIFIDSTFNFIELDQDMRLLLFNKLYNSGYFCYTAVTSQQFQDNWDYIKPDLKIISELVNSPSLEALDTELKDTLEDFYLYEDTRGLKDILL